MKSLWTSPKSSITLVPMALVVLLGCGAPRAATTSTSGPAPQSRVEMPFDEYDFRRTADDPKALRYLMGNAEMGGLADLRGLGFSQRWFTDVWSDPTTRRGVEGPLLSTPDDDVEKREVSHFDQRLSLRDGILKTVVGFADESGYETEIFFSRDEEHLLVIRVRSLSTKTSTWRLGLSSQDFEIEKEGAVWSGHDERHFSKPSWALAVEGVDVSRRDDATIEFQLADNQEAIILYSLTTHFDGQDYVAQALDAVTRQTSFRELKRLTLQASAGMWSQMGSILLPEGDYAKWFYRSLYFLVSTAGADHFLPGELQFSIPTDWDMHAFTYGHAGWSTLAFASMGHRDKAYRMAEWHYQPEALRANVDRIFPQQGEVDLSYRGENRGKYFYLENRSPEAIAFGPELTAFGYDVTYPNDAHWDWQRHLDGFGAARLATMGAETC